MNITRNDAGSVGGKYILSKGFKVFDKIEGNDMGQCEWSIPQYKNSKCTITGGYWHWKVKDNDGNELFGGWWNSNEEFEKTMTELGLI
jgi:hypothetical protein